MHLHWMMKLHPFSCLLFPSFTLVSRSVSGVSSCLSHFSLFLLSLFFLPPLSFSLPVSLILFVSFFSLPFTFTACYATQGQEEGSDRPASIGSVGSGFSPRPGRFLLVIREERSRGGSREGASKGAIEGGDRGHLSRPSTQYW